VTSRVAVLPASVTVPSTDATGPLAVSCAARPGAESSPRPSSNIAIIVSRAICASPSSATVFKRNPVPALLRSPAVPERRPSHRYPRAVAIPGALPRPLRFPRDASPRRSLAAVGARRACALLAVAGRGSPTLEERGRSGPAHDLIEAHHLQHHDNDDHRADQVHDRIHVTSLPSGWLAAFCVLTVPCGSGQVVPRLQGSCGVPSPDPFPAAPRTPASSGVCKARSSPLAG